MPTNDSLRRRLHPSLVVICDLPADPHDLTDEQCRAVFGGDISVLSELIQRGYDHYRTPLPAAPASDVA